MREYWSTRWYAPLLALGGLIVLLLVLALAVIELLSRDARASDIRLSMAPMSRPHLPVARRSGAHTLPLTLASDGPARRSTPRTAGGAQP